MFLFRYGSPRMNAGSESTIDTIGWRDVSFAIKRHLALAVTVFLVTVLISLAIAFLMTPIYRSEVLLVPAKDEQTGGGLSSALGRLGGLAGLAGINLPLGGNGATEQALKVLQSRGFLADFIQSRNLLPILFAEDWNVRSQTWSVLGDDIPTLYDGVERFHRRVLNVDDSGGSTVRIMVDWTDRELAAEWANGLVEALNERMRKRALTDSKRSLEYLEKQLAETSTVEVRESIYRLMAEQLNKAMLATVRKEFAFEVLDGATVSDAHRPQRPRKEIVLPVGFFAGVALAALAVAFRAGLSRSIKD